MHKQFYILSLLIILLSSCSQSESKKTNKDYSIYCEDTAMAHFITEPDRALLLLDSAVILDKITPARGKYLKAIVMFNGKNKTDSCIAMCQDLIDNEVWEDNRIDEPESFQVSIYRLMATASMHADNYMNVLRYAREGVKMAHGNPDLIGSEADLLSRLGFVMCQLGQHSEGIDALNRAEQLTKNESNWSSLIAYLNTTKKIYHAYDMMERYSDAKTEVFDALNRIDYVRHNLKKIDYVPEAMLVDSSAFEECANYYETTFHCYLTNIYANEQNTDSALYWLNVVKESSQADNPSLNTTLIDPLIKMGRYDEAKQMIADHKELAGADTTSTDYISLQKQEMLLCMETGQTTTANLLAQSIIHSTDNIKVSEMRMMLADAATQYQLQEERLLRKDAEDRLLTIIIALILTVSLISGTCIFIYLRKLMAKHKELKQLFNETKEELDYIKEDQNNEERVKIPEEALEDIYRRAVEYMETFQPYRDSKCDINSIALELNTNRYYISNAVNSIAGMNFRSWLAKYRVEHAKYILLSTPNITNDDLAIKCGFDNRTSLYRQFKSIEGITPTEWLKAQETK